MLGCGTSAATRCSDMSAHLLSLLWAGHQGAIGRELSCPAGLPPAVRAGTCTQRCNKRRRGFVVLTRLVGCTVVAPGQSSSLRPTPAGQHCMTRRPTSSLALQQSPAGRSSRSWSAPPAPPLAAMRTARIAGGRQTHSCRLPCARRQLRCCAAHSSHAGGAAAADVCRRDLLLASVVAAGLQASSSQALAADTSPPFVTTASGLKVGQAAGPGDTAQQQPLTQCALRPCPPPAHRSRTCAQETGPPRGLVTWCPCTGQATQRATR